MSSILLAAVKKQVASLGKNSISLKHLQKKLGPLVTDIQLKEALKTLQNEGYLKFYDGKIEKISAKKAKDSSISTGRKVTGRIDMTMNGYAFLISDDLDKDVRIEARQMGSALDKDTVTAELVLNKNAKKAPRNARVVEVITRAQDTFVGVLQINERFAFLITDSKKMPVDIFIPLNKLKGAKTGEQAIVKVLAWHGAKEKNPVGEVIEVLGTPGTNDAGIRAILAENGFTTVFPDAVLAEAEAIEEGVDAFELTYRTDYRQILTFTIDPEDAKDFDDAISFRVLPDGMYEVGVHIADVSHYVRPGSALDNEAVERTTSVYLVDRVVPMLPEKLSNNICSLVPGKDRLTFGAIFVLDDKGKIHKRAFARTIIHSAHRFSYEAAQAVLETGDGPHKEALLTLNGLAKQIRERRYKNGAINFDTTEVRFKLNELGEPIDVYIKERKDAHLLIEDFMLMANEAVAEFVSNKEVANKPVPFPYRIHDIPDMEKVATFGNVALECGYKLTLDTPKQIASSFNKLLQEIKGKPEQAMLEQLGIRCMAKAAYSTQNIGHYGLAFKHYGHFTSPIRRYPDVLAHRVLWSVLQKEYSQLPKDMEPVLEHCSSQERKAMEAEYASIKMKQVEYMSKQVGKTFDGVISGVTAFGIFVEELHSQSEGLIRFTSLTGDTYEFNEKQHKITGRRTGIEYKLGGVVRVKVLGTDARKRNIDYELVQD